MSSKSDPDPLVVLQWATELRPLPGVDDFQKWVALALEGQLEQGEVAIRLVDHEESAQLNTRYRGKQGSTNVLSFPMNLPSDVGLSLLGDIVICAPVVVAQAAEQGKSADAHWAHLTIHGVLHLIGYDHVLPDDAEQMERREIAILKRLGYPDPYDEY
ncbi:MAG: rRNA maturation RNase YbeY [Pseudomonadota bacterium]|nr:rRNA maturation RNase YbeY [Pseudomonadota bacterium]